MKVGSKPASCYGLEEMKKNKTMFRMTVRIPEDLAEKVKISAVKRKVTLQDAVAQALQAWLREASK